MTSRTLPIINAIGCLVLTGVVVLQWRKERALDASLDGMRAELSAAKGKADEETKRRAALERDIEVLKDSIASTQQAAENVTQNLAQKDQAAAQFQTELSAARDQLTLWEAALKARDDRIVSLDANLAATRKRLDEAVAKLRSAGAR